MVLLIVPLFCESFFRLLARKVSKNYTSGIAFGASIPALPKLAPTQQALNMGAMTLCCNALHFFSAI
jgi:hypothetical protein